MTTKRGAPGSRPKQKRPLTLPPPFFWRMNAELYGLRHEIRQAHWVDPQQSQRNGITWAVAYAHTSTLRFDGTLVNFPTHRQLSRFFYRSEWDELGFLFAAIMNCKLPHPRDGRRDVGLPRDS